MLSRVQGVLHELWGTKNAFQDDEYRKHRSTISGIVLRFEDIGDEFGYWKNRSTILQHRTTMKGSIWVGSWVNDPSYYDLVHRSTVCAWTYKILTDFWGKGSKFYREKETFGAGSLSRRWETIKTHNWLRISYNDFFFNISYLCFSHE